MVEDLSGALYSLKKTLYDEKHVSIIKETPYDQHRKFILLTHDKKKMLLLFKREFFMSYGKITGRHGAGESINVIDFNVAQDNGIEEAIYYYRSNKVYVVRLREILHHKHDYVNESDQRKQFLFPLSIMKPLIGEIEVNKKLDDFNGG